MQALTPAERRGALVLVGLLALGAGRDLWIASRPLPERAAVLAHAAPEDGTPNAGSRSGTSPAPPESGTVVAPMSALDLNRATAIELDALPGIGPVLAARIVAQRERVGRFERAEDLLAVRGIGHTLFGKLRDRVTVSAASPAPPASSRRRGAPPGSRPGP